MDILLLAADPAPSDVGLVWTGLKGLAMTHGIGAVLGGFLWDLWLRRSGRIKAKSSR